MLSPCCLLIVDAEPRFRQLFRLILDEPAWEVRELSHPSAAWGLLGTEPPTVAMIEVCRPHDAGYQLLHTVLADPAFDAIRFVALVDHPGAVERLQAQYPRLQLLAKPFGVQEVLRVTQPVEPAAAGLSLVA